MLLPSVSGTAAFPPPPSAGPEPPVSEAEGSGLGGGCWGGRGARGFPPPHASVVVVKLCAGVGEVAVGMLGRGQRTRQGADKRGATSRQPLPCGAWGCGGAGGSAERVIPSQTFLLGQAALMVGPERVCAVVHWHFA